MRKVLTIAGIATLVAVLGVAALGAVAIAQDGEDGILPFNFREKMQEAIAGILGIPVEDYNAAVDTAKEQVLEEAVAEGALTQEQAERMQERWDQDFVPGAMGPRGGKFGGMRGGPMGGPAGGHLATVAEALDMPVEDLLNELKDGKTIAELAEEQGVDVDSLVDACVEQMTERLAEAVENGRLSQEQADSMLEQMAETIQKFIEEGFSGDEGFWPHDFRRGGRPGEFEGFPGQDDA